MKNLLFKILDAIKNIFHEIPVAKLFLVAFLKVKFFQNRREAVKLT